MAKENLIRAEHRSYCLDISETANKPNRRAEGPNSKIYCLPPTSSLLRCTSSPLLSDCLEGTVSPRAGANEELAEDSGVEGGDGSSLLLFGAGSASTGC